MRYNNKQMHNPQKKTKNNRKGKEVSDKLWIPTSAANITTKSNSKGWFTHPYIIYILLLTKNELNLNAIQFL